MSPSPDDFNKDRIFDFAHPFDAMDGSFSRRSPVPEHLLENFFDTGVTSAISKCIDFNHLVNRELQSDLLPIFLMANSGSICEELICIDYRGAATVLPVLPDADTPVGDKGHAGDRFRGALARRGTAPCISGRASRTKPVEYHRELYKQRTLIERMFGRLKGWRRIAAGCDRCAHTVFSAICIAATVIFWS